MAGIAALAVAYIFSQFYRSFLAVLTPALTVEIGMTDADLSLASGVWFLTFALMQFVVGVCLDHFGPRRTAAVIFAVGTGGGALLFGLAGSPIEIIIAMGMIGIGCAPVLMAAFFLFAKLYSPARFAILSSWFFALGTLGNVLGAKPLAIAIDTFGWRPSILALGIVSVVTAIAVLMISRDPPRDTADERGGSGFAGYLDLLRRPVLWLIIPLITLNYAPVAGIRGLWIGRYLDEVYGASLQVIGDISLIMAIAMVLGAVLYGPLDTLFGTRKWILFVGNALSAVVLAIMALFPAQPLWQVTVLVFAVGLFGTSFGLLMAHARAFIPAHLTGRGVTLMNFFSIGGVGAMQLVTGRIVTWTFDPAAPDVAYSSVFAAYAVLLAISLAIYLKIPDRKPL